MKTATPKATTEPKAAHLPQLTAPPSRPHLLVNMADWSKEQLAPHERPGRLQPDAVTASHEAVRLANLHPGARIAVFECVGFVEVEGPTEYTFHQALETITGTWGESHALPLFKRWLGDPKRSRTSDKPVDVEALVARWRKGGLAYQVVLQAREGFREWQKAQAAKV